MQEAAPVLGLQSAYLGALSLAARVGWWVMKSPGQRQVGWAPEVFAEVCPGLAKGQIGKEFGNESHLRGAQAGDRPGMQPVGIASPTLVPWAPFSSAAVAQIVHLLQASWEAEVRKKPGIPRSCKNSSRLKKQVIAATVSRATVLMENNQS